MLHVSEELNASPRFHFLYLFIFIVFTAVLFYIRLTGQSAQGCCDVRDAFDPGLCAKCTKCLLYVCLLHIL